MIILKTLTLTDFIAEIPFGGAVRMASYERITQTSTGGWKELCIDAMTTEKKCIIWFHYSVKVQISPGSHEPWTETGKAVQAAWPQLYDLIWAYIDKQNGVSIRPGLYGIPDNITPFNGDLGMITWNNNTSCYEVIS